MANGAIIVSFVVIFVLILLAVSVAMKYFDARRKSQVAGMLRFPTNVNANAGDRIGVFQQPGLVCIAVKETRRRRHCSIRVHQQRQHFAHTPRRRIGNGIGPKIMIQKEQAHDSEQKN